MFAADDPLQVAVLPVEVTCLHRPGEHRPPWPGQRICGTTATRSVSQSPVLTLQVESIVCVSVFWCSPWDRLLCGRAFVMFGSSEP